MSLLRSFVRSFYRWVSNPGRTRSKKLQLWEDRSVISSTHSPLTFLTSPALLELLSGASIGAVSNEIMKTQIKEFTIVLAASLLFSGWAAASDFSLSRRSHIYNLTTEWSNTNNPNGVWSYNQNTEIG